MVAFHSVDGHLAYLQFSPNTEHLPHEHAGWDKEINILSLPCLKSSLCPISESWVDEGSPNLLATLTRNLASTTLSRERKHWWDAGSLLLSVRYLISRLGTERKRRLILLALPTWIRASGIALRWVERGEWAGCCLSSTDSHCSCWDCADFLEVSSFAVCP